MQVKKLKWIVTVFLGTMASPVFPQKPTAYVSKFRDWPGVGTGYLSNDGKYLECQISGIEPKYIITSVDHAWSEELKDVKNSFFFALNSSMLIFGNLGDSLCLQRLGTDRKEYIANVQTFEATNSGSAVWLAYLMTGSSNELRLRNLVSGKEQSFKNVLTYQFNPGNTALLFRQRIGDTTISLQWVELGDASETSKTIWQGRKIDYFIFPTDMNEMIFLADDPISRGGKSIWRYKAGRNNAEMLLASNSPEIGRDLKLDQLIEFNSLSDKLFVSLKRFSPKPKPVPGLASVDVYSYKDPKLQSQQLRELQFDSTFIYAFNVAERRLIPLENGNEYLIRPLENSQVQNFVLTTSNHGGSDVEWNWNPAALYSIFLVSTAEGSRKCIGKSIPFDLVYSYNLSNNNKYVTYYDAAEKSYFSYNVATGVVKNITKGINVNWLSSRQEDCPDSGYEVDPAFNWLANDTAVLIHSQNDIIQADPTGLRPAFSLTGFYGPVHHLQFDRAPALEESGVASTGFGQKLLFHFVSEVNRREGFCWIIPGNKTGIEILKMFPERTAQLQKARDASVYCLQMGDAAKSPNLFVTTDFKTFAPITNIYPERLYNWMTTELVKWNVPGGRPTQGILYKPENFDPKEKYPVILFYYERMSDRLHNFLGITNSDAQELDINYYINNGYLVFIPDIYYKVGYPGRSAYITIISAAKYLSRFPWIATQHMGLMGHSFGGFETNYVITHSHLFAAAISSAGMTDFVSAYGSIIGDGTSRQRQYELSRDRIGASLWQRPDLYIENSPVFKADKVTTPVLLMANKKDEDVPYEQGFEFFTALRRLGKKAWLLQYDNSGHGLENDADVKDFTIRSHQFFDYYLKGDRPPEWLTIGVPARLKSIDSGLEIDSSGRKP